MPTEQGPCHIVLLGNSVKELVGREHLKIYKLRSNSTATMHVATCCWAIMAVNDPEVGPHAFPSPTDFNQIICGHDIARVLAEARIFTAEFGSDGVDLPEWNGLDCPTKAAMNSSGFSRRFAARAKKMVTKMPGDMSLNEIEKMMWDRGGPPKIAGAD